MYSCVALFAHEESGQSRLQFAVWLTLVGNHGWLCRSCRRLEWGRHLVVIGGTTDLVPCHHPCQVTLNLIEDLVPLDEIYWNPLLKWVDLAHLSEKVPDRWYQYWPPGQQGTRFVVSVMATRATCPIDISLTIDPAHIDGLVPDCSNSSALAVELLQSCTKPLICVGLLSNWHQFSCDESFITGFLPVGCFFVVKLPIYGINV